MMACIFSFSSYFMFFFHRFSLFTNINTVLFGRLMLICLLMHQPTKMHIAEEKKTYLLNANLYLWALLEFQRMVMKLLCSTRKLRKLRNIIRNKERKLIGRRKICVKRIKKNCKNFLYKCSYSNDVKNA